MTLKELYQNIDGDYDQALRVLRVEKLLDKHIRKLTQNGVIDALLAAGKTMDPTQMFETAHAAKGVCGNLGLVKLAAAASDIAEEYRPGNARKLSDAEVSQRLADIEAMYQKAAEGIKAYIG